MQFSVLHDPLNDCAYKIPYLFELRHLLFLKENELNILQFQIYLQLHFVLRY